MFGTRRKKWEPIVRELVPLNFKSDIVFLDQMIQHKLDFYNKFELEVRIGISKYQLSDRHIKPILISVSEDIIKSLSSNYKTILFLYFTEKSLEEYVVERIMLSLKDKYIKRPLPQTEEADKPSEKKE